MEMIMIKDKAIWRQAEEVLLLLAAFSIPFVNFAPVPSILITVMSLVLWAKAFVDGRKPLLNYAALAMLCFYLYAILSSVSYGLSEIFWRETTQIRLPLLFFSLAFLFSAGNVDVRRVMRWFALGAVACALVCCVVFGCALITDFDGVPHSAMNLKLCLNGVLMLISHRTYVGFNLLVGLIVLFQEAMDRRERRLWFLFVLLALFSGGFILFSGARMVLLSYSVLLFAFLLIFLSRRYEAKRVAIISLVAFLLLGGLMLMNGRMQDLVISLYRGDVDFTSIDPRFSIWYCAAQVLHHNDIPFMGVGTGMAPELLYLEYQAFGFMSGMEMHYNMHNQFLESFVEYGCVGLLLLVAMLLPAVFGSTRNRLFFRLYAVLLVLNLFFESMFCRSIGTYSIAFVVALSGLRGEPLQMVALGRTLRKVLYGLLLVVVAAISVKYVFKDKRLHFASFQRYLERVDQLPGDVPAELQGVEGRKADCRTTSDTWHGKATTYYRFDSFDVAAADSVDFSLYLFVSDDFDGAEVEMKLEERGRFTYAERYDLSRKGTWQRLHVGKSGMQGNVVCTFAFSKENASDLKDLKGFVLFAKPATECIRR